MFVVPRSVVAIIILVTLMLAWFSLRAEGQVTKQVTCSDAQMQESMRRIVLQGLDEALRDQAKHLFGTWLRDSHDQPTRAITGMRNAISAYLLAYQSTTDWSLPLCSQGSTK